MNVLTRLWKSFHSVYIYQINNRNKAGKLTNIWILNNTLLNNQWVEEEVKGIFKNILKQMKMEPQGTKTIGMLQKQF